MEVWYNVKVGLNQMRRDNGRVVEDHGGGVVDVLLLDGPEEGQTKLYIGTQAQNPFQYWEEKPLRTS